MRINGISSYNTRNKNVNFGWLKIDPQAKDTLTQLEKDANDPNNRFAPEMKKDLENITKASEKMKNSKYFHIYVNDRLTPELLCTNDAFWGSFRTTPWSYYDIKRMPRNVKEPILYEQYADRLEANIGELAKIPVDPKEFAENGIQPMGYVRIFNTKNKNNEDNLTRCDIKNLDHRLRVSRNLYMSNIIPKPAGLAINTSNGTPDIYDINDVADIALKLEELSETANKKFSGLDENTLPKMINTDNKDYINPDAEVPVLGKVYVSQKGLDAILKSDDADIKLKLIKNALQNKQKKTNDLIIDDKGDFKIRNKKLGTFVPCPPANIYNDMINNDFRITIKYDTGEYDKLHLRMNDFESLKNLQKLFAMTPFEIGTVALYNVMNEKAI